MKWLVLVAMVGGGLFLGPLLIMLWVVALFSVVGAASLCSLAGSMLSRVRGS